MYIHKWTLISVKSVKTFLYLYIDSETNKIVLQCKACGYEKPMENKVIKINNNTNINVDKRRHQYKSIYYTRYVTLPTIKNNKNIKCQNEECTAEQIDIKYIKYDDENNRNIYTSVIIVDASGKIVFRFNSMFYNILF